MSDEADYSRVFCVLFNRMPRWLEIGLLCNRTYFTLIKNLEVGHQNGYLVSNLFSLIVLL